MNNVTHFKEKQEIQLLFLYHLGNYSFPMIQKTLREDAQKCAMKIEICDIIHFEQQRVASPSGLEGFREFEVDLSALFIALETICFLCNKKPFERLILYSSERGVL